MSSDIAHELKTPIAELINLAEVSLKFPDDKSLSSTFAPEVLAISLRLEKIVANILLFHRYSHPVFEKNDVFDVFQVIHRLADKYPRVRIVSQPDVLMSSSLFAFETIMANLLQNATIYSPEDSVINVAIAMPANEGVLATISNTCTNPPSNDELLLMFDPLWQKDSSRTSTENFGLGLSIVNTFTRALGGNVKVTLEQNIISFSLFLPN